MHKQNLPAFAAGACACCTGTRSILGESPDPVAIGFVGMPYNVAVMLSFWIHVDIQLESWHAYSTHLSVSMHYTLHQWWATIRICIQLNPAMYFTLYFAYSSLHV